MIALITFMVSSGYVFAQSDETVVYSVSFNNTGTKLAVGHNTGLVEIIDTVTEQRLQSFHFSGRIWEVAWSPQDSDILAIVANYIDMPGTLHILNTTTDEEIITLTEGEQIISITWSPDGNRIAASIGFTTSLGISRYITIWDTVTWQVSSIIGIGPVEAFSLAWSPDGSRIVSGDNGGTITLWDVTTGTADTILVGHTSAVYSVVWSPDGSRLASASSLEDPTIRVWDAATGAALLVIPDSGADHIAWNSDGTRIAAADLINIVRIWDAFTGKLVDTISQTDDVYSLAWTPNGNKLALGDASGSIHLIQLPLASADR